MEVFYKHFSLRACFLALWIMLVQASIRIETIPKNLIAGQNGLFSVEGVQGNISKIMWYRGGDSKESLRIFTFSPGNYIPQENGAQFTNREFGFPNGSIQITGLRLSDSSLYHVVILMRRQEALIATIDIQLDGSPGATATTLTTATTATTATSTGTSPVKEVPKEPSKLCWIVAGVLIGALLCGVLVAIMVYRFVLRKSEPSAGVTGKLDQGARISTPSDHDGNEPVYDPVYSPVETPKDPFPILSGPLPPLAATCPQLGSNYTE